MKNLRMEEAPDSNWKRIWKRCLSMEIGIEYKSCLYFFAILFFDSMYLVIQETYFVSLLHMAEIILATYGMGYLQVLLMGNFDEAERFGKREIVYTLLCSGLYTGISFLCGWFDRQPTATGLFALYCVALFLSAYLANKVKRNIDTEQLNIMLQAYKRGGKQHEQCHRNEEPDQDIR